ncbi:hypothetical protein ABD76_20065 [Paenibacillus dendritiformis]|uniref:hypothetical protein n=1 Tax=Paenibacillus dendritiformis TaxID=130049 RepID=UPI0018CEACB5|nr:hypothetical protein [Paenibacillus dendritiformis]MBG9794658.1 hypothetical protein [Paenibacillus dendritiformis]
MKELSPEALEARRQYEREYRRKWRQKPENKEKQREYERRYWERKAKQPHALIAQTVSTCKARTYYPTRNETTIQTK